MSLRKDINAYVRSVVDAAPPLNSEQRARLAVLLRPTSVPVVQRPVERREAA